MGLLDKTLGSIGRAAGTFAGEFSKARHGLSERPAFLDAWARSEQWKGGQNWSDPAAQMRAMTNSWLFMAIDLIAREVGSAPFQVTRQAGLDDDAEQIVNHPLERLMRRPNAYMGGGFFWQYSTAWYLLDGNFYWFVAQDETGQVAELWPLPAAQVQVWPGDGERFVDHYKYFVQGVEYDLPAEYVVHVMRPNPFDIYRGLSPLTAAMLPVDADNAMARWNGSFFGQDNVMPSAIINLSSGDTNKPINPKDAAALKADLQRDYQATSRKTAITTANGVQAVLLGWNAKDMDFLAGRQFTKEEIWDIYGIPPGMLDPNATEANAVVAERVFKNNVWGTLALFGEQITAELAIPFYGPNLQAGWADIRPANRTQELAEDAQARATLTIDERRAKFWKAAPLPDGRGALTELEATPAAPGMPDAPEMLPVPGPLPSAAPPAAKAAQFKELRAWREKALRAAREGKSATFTSTTLPPETVARILAGLAGAQTPNDVKVVFVEAQAELDAVPEVAAPETFFRDEGEPPGWEDYAAA
jgi:HK97 family phage portal protein